MRTAQKTYEKLHNSRSAKMGDRININLSSKDESVPDFLNNQKNDNFWIATIPDYHITSYDQQYIATAYDIWI